MAKKSDHNYSAAAIFNVRLMALPACFSRPTSIFLVFVFLGWYSLTAFKLFY
jgi:hypothetical protein